MKIVLTIEARMTSSRLPGKVALPALKNQTMLGHMIQRLKRVPSVDQIVVATTTNSSDDLLQSIAEGEGVTCFRGSEDDVMGRVIGAAKSAGAELLVETTGDCPIIDSSIVEQTIRMFLHHDVDYVSNAFVRSFPDGMDCQVYRLATLEKSYSMTNSKIDREHVTRHILANPDLFERVQLVAPPDLWWPELGLTLDEPKDYELIKRIVDYFGEDNPAASCGEILHVLRAVHPEWVKINEDVKRKIL